MHCFNCERFHSFSLDPRLRQGLCLTLRSHVFRNESQTEGSNKARHVFVWMSEEQLKFLITVLIIDGFHIQYHHNTCSSNCHFIANIKHVQTAQKLLNPDNVRSTLYKYVQLHITPWKFDLRVVGLGRQSQLPKYLNRCHRHDQHNDSRNQQLLSYNIWQQLT